MAEMTENLLRLRSVQGVGSIILWRLLRRFGDSDGVLGARAEELAGVKGVSPDMAARILEAGTHDPRPEMEKAVQAGVDIIPYDDPGYPRPLLHTFDPPAVLYVRGRLAEEDQVAIGIVGTRNCSKYGRDNALDLSGALARSGYTVVSGLARGVDTFAHMGAMRAGGRTVGVLGCGFDHMYPEENRDLALMMTQSGAVVTEFSMATRPSRETFPTRNRIIAGMGLGLLVIEAPMRSGSLITARLANEIGRTVFAVPGRMDDARSSGCNKLIRDGAAMVTGVDDIFRELNPALELPEAAERPGKTAQQRKTGKQPAPKKGAGKTAQSPNHGNQALEAKSIENKDSPNAAGMEQGPAVRKPIDEGGSRPRPKLSEEQRQVLDAVGAEWIGVDDVIAQSGLEAGLVTASLVLLRLMRLVEQGPGQTYRKR